MVLISLRPEGSPTIPVPPPMRQWLIARHLETFHKAKGHKMAYMKAVCSRIKTDVEYGFAFVYHFFDFFFVCHLGDEPLAISSS